MARFTYYACHPVQRHLLAQIRMQAVSWTEVVNGAGQFSGTFVLPVDENRINALRIATEPDESALYVRADSGAYVWGGPIIDQDWNWEENTVTITAVEWRSWLFSVFLGPKLDLSGDNVYSWVNKDQLLIAREIMGFATVAGATDGRPPIMIGTELSGKMRDLTLKGMDFRYAGEILDGMSQRDGGFEWDIISQPHPVDGLPQLHLALYFPERGSQPPGLLFRQTRTGGNMKLREPIMRSAAERRTRVWTTGTISQVSQVQVANDSDPILLTGFGLLRERQTSYPTVIERTTLAAHARAERAFLSPKVNGLAVQTAIDAPNVLDYRAGDRARLIYEDRLYQIDLPAVRIVERVIRPDLGVVDSVLDLEDFEAPEVDAAGAV